jgi:hypothetical protein
MHGLITNLKTRNITITHGELLLKDYKVILKSLFDSENSPETFFHNLNNILQKNTSLTYDELYNLDIITYLLLLCSIRANSFGGILLTTFTEKDDKGKDIPINVEIKLSKTIDNLQHFNKKNYTNTIPFDLGEIIVDIPTVYNLVHNTNAQFIKNFKVNGILLTNEKYQACIDDLPVKLLLQTNKHTQYLQKKIEDIYFFNGNNKKYDIKLSAKLLEYVFLIKFLFSENLKTIYDNIFYLSKIFHMSAEYLENCNYGEFLIYVKKAEAYLKTTASTQQTNTSHNITDNFDFNQFYTKGNKGGSVANSEFTP